MTGRSRTFLIVLSIVFLLAAAPSGPQRVVAISDIHGDLDAFGILQTSSSSLKAVYEQEEHARNNNVKEQGEYQHPKLWQAGLQECRGLEAFVTSRHSNRRAQRFLRTPVLHRA